MFTGIIEATGIIKNLKKGAKSLVIWISAPDIMDDLKLGDSVAVNGVCLTVTEIRSDTFSADVMSETVRRSNLGHLKTGDAVNLERAMPANGRFGGHIVSGHIDGTGEICDIKKDDNAVWFSVKADPDILKYIVMKGSIAIDGISLTVAYVDNLMFKVSVIPHTLSNTILANKKSGDTVNLENDIIGKYVERLISVDGSSANKKSSFEDLLINNGFI